MNRSNFLAENRYFSSRKPVFAQNCVATSHPLATQAGIKMLTMGGNAVDAALAAAIAQTVVEPITTSIGSDLFAIVWDGTQLHGLNGSGRSPQDWSSQAFTAKYQTMPLSGWDCVTVPGAISAWTELSEKFGQLPYAQLFSSAIDYAENGYLVPPVVAQIWKESAKQFADNPYFRELFLPNGKAPEVGQLFKAPLHGKTLRKIADSHGEAFYKGELAKAIVAQAEKDGAKLSLSDLANHQSNWVDPISIDYYDHDIFELPPNCQGLTALIALGILRHIDITKYPVDSVESIHIQIEVMKLAFADAAQHIADPDFMKTDVHHFLDADYLKQRSTLINLNKAQRPSCGFPLEAGTVYLTAADASGMMVSLIQSHYRTFGSGVTIPDTGIVMQNRGNCFSLTQGHPNQVAGNKLPFHTIMPGFIMKANQPVMSFGAMGGYMQAQAHLQMITRLCSYQQNPQAMIDAPRWYISPQGQISIEPQFDQKIAAGLIEKGHQMIDNPTPIYGGAQAIYRLDDGYLAASEPRKDGHAAGF